MCSDWTSPKKSQVWAILQASAPFKVYKYSIAGLPLALPILELHSLNSLAPPVSSHYIVMYQTLFDLAEVRQCQIRFSHCYLHHILSPVSFNKPFHSILLTAISWAQILYLSYQIHYCHPPSSPIFHFSIIFIFYILYYFELHVCIAGSLACPSSFYSKVVWSRTWSIRGED